MLRSALAFLSGMADVASVLHIMILCSLLPPAPWVAGPALMLEIQGPEKSQIWPGLAWPPKAHGFVPKAHGLVPKAPGLVMASSKPKSCMLAPCFACNFLCRPFKPC